MLEIDTVSKRFRTTVALDEMTFTVRPGELFGFVGANGAGKTTTMRIAMGVLAADSGEVRVHGRPVDLAARRRMGYMPEQRGLYPKMAVGEQLRYLAELRGRSRAEARAATDHWTERLGVADRRGDEVQKLSLGNQQRVQLAAALVHDPDVLLLDEPFSGLDPVAVDIMSAVLRERSDAGAPVVFSSHQLDLVERLCDRVGIVRDGRLVAEGSVDALRADAAGELIVDAPAAPDGWADGLPGVAGAHVEHGRTVVRLQLTGSTAAGSDTHDTDDTDETDQRILAAALATGPVREFRRRRPTLADLFRGVVADPGGATQERAAAVTA